MGTYFYFVPSMVTLVFRCLLLIADPGHFVEQVLGSGTGPSGTGPGGVQFQWDHSQLRKQFVCQR